MSLDAVLYARVSSPEQEKEGYSQGDQIDDMRQYAKRLGLNVVQEFIVQESAKEEGRAAFNQAVGLLKKKSGPKVFLVTQVDRLTRNFTDAVVSEELIKKYGVTIHLVKEGMVLHKDSNSAQMAFFYQMVVMAKHYIDRLSENTRNGMRQKAREGGWYASAPYGYKMVQTDPRSEKKNLVPDPEEMPFVKEAFRLYSTGLYSLQGTADILRQTGFVFRPSQPRIPKGTIERMLRRRIYIGDIEKDGQIYQGKHQPIIPLDIWEKVQKAFKKDGKPMTNQKHSFVYRGMLNCGECGGLMTGENKKGGRYTYYRCTSNSNSTGKCSQGYLSEVEIDRQVKQDLARLVPVPEYREDVMRAYEALDVTKANTDEDQSRELADQLSRAKRNLREAYHDLKKGLIDEEMYSDLTREYKEEIDGLMVRIEAIGKTDIDYFQVVKQLIELPEFLNREWIQADASDKTELLNIVYSNFSVKDGKISGELKAPFSLLAERALLKIWGE